MRCRFCLVSILAGTILWPSLAQSEDLRPEARIAIVRALTAEYATVKESLPRGSEGLFLKTTGEIDRNRQTREITQNGTAIQPNILVQITGIEFQDGKIAFEINGGGERETKWYEHIEVGIGGYGTHPITTGQQTRTPTGSMITLEFPGRTPNLSVDQVKAYLEPVLDFTATTPIQTLSRPFPKEFQKAIEAKTAVVGMNRDMVLAALGPPERKVREVVDGVEREDWIYGTPPMKVTFVTFEGEEVVDVQEYLGGVSGRSEGPYSTEPRR